MKDLSLEITLETGEKAIFPLSYRAAEYFQGNELHESQIPCMRMFQESRLDDFTGSEYSWAVIEYHYIEGLTTTGEQELTNSEEQTELFFSWKILLDDKPASHAEVEQFLNGVSA